MAALARQVLLEALRGGIARVALGALAAALLFAWFLAEVALVEARQFQVASAAALLRVCSVFLVAGNVVVATVREFQDKSLELNLAQPIPRGTYYAGRLAGHALLGTLLALLFCAPLLLWADPLRVAQWALSLAIENLLVACAALFFALGSIQAVTALAATIGLYVLGRAISAIQSIAAGPLADDGALQRFGQLLIDAASYLLPRLDLATRTEWLLYGTPPAGAYLGVLGEMLVYCLLLAAAGLFDLQRREL